MADEPRLDDGIPTTDDDQHPLEDTNDQHQLLVQAAAGFLDALDRDAGIEQTLEDTLERYLAVPPDPKAATRLRFAVHHLVGAQGGSYLLHYLESDEPEDVLAALAEVEVDERLRGRAEAVLRRLQAFYGYPIQEVSRIHGMHPLDWDRVEPQVSYETLKGGWRVGLLIRRFDGQSLQLEMTPDSAARLGAWILRQLNAVGDDVFDTAALGELIGETTELLAKFGGTVEFGAPADGATGDGGAAATAVGAGIEELIPEQA